MEAVKNQLADQVDLAGRINRVVVNLEKKGKLKITVGLIKSRMQQTKDHWAEFCANHKILVAKARESAEVRQTDYFSQDYFQSVEELYQDQMGTLIDMMAAYQELQEPSVDLPESNVVINHTPAARPRAVLPRIELPTFDGHFRDWMPFHDLFQSLILNDSSLTDVERLHYLKNQLKGDALQMLQNLPTTEGNFQRAWDLLKTRFENTRLLISSQLENLYQVAPMAKESEEEIKRVLYSTCDCVEALAALKRPVDSTSDWLVHLTVNRLDSQSRREWETSLGGDTDPPTFEKCQRIVWRSSAELPVQEYYLTTLTYGLVCSPFIANRTLRQLADDERSRFPLASQVLKNDTYVDDVLTGAATVEKAIELQRELRELCKAGGFSLRKWVSNSKEVLAAIGESGPMSSEAWKSADNTTLLGVRWSASTDAFHFEVNTTLVETPITKRKALSEIAKIFDPLGWLSPVTIWAKCFMQSLWLLKTSWDEPLASAEDKTWNKFREELPQLNRLSQPRWLGTSPTDEVELHGFADASERAYAAVAYLRIRDASGRVKISLLGAKTKVAPLKQVSLPRLELCAAMLLAQHVKKLLGALRTKPVSIHLWSDSTVTLGWIRGHPTKWKTYVANRVSQIQCLIPQALWHHVSGLENPADCASRGLMPSVLPSFSLWWEGPPFLKDEISYPELDIPSPQEEQRLQSHLASKQPSELPKNPLLCRFSSLTRLLRVSAWCLRWRSPTSPKIRSPSLSSEELQEVRLRWVRLEQELFFAKDLRELRRTQQLPATSKMSSLAPFLDAHGVLRVRGRLANSLLSYKEQHPFILPAESILTRLLVEEVHQRHLHSGTQLTLAALRQEAWILKGRQAVRSVLHKCTVCIRWRARAGTQLMADLPADRVQPGRPFSNVGVDYAGPIWVRAAKGRGQHAYKGYIAVFICLATRAMHLEAVSSADTASFLAALQRFLSRRRFSSRIYSDCGTNFVGADRELKELLAAAQLENSPLTSFCADRGIEWRFNPPGAPHFGGLWEAGVKSVKHHLRRIMGEQKLTFEELSTLLARIEACLNSRPLQALSDDPQDIAALTPGHFLVGSALTAVPEPSLEEVPISRLSRWQLVTQKQQHFWRRWSREYIATLQPRGKWRRMTATMKEGDLCLILNETLPPTRWPLARVTVLHKGRDGLPRVATLRTATGELTRPITKLVMLPAESGDAAASPPLKTGQCE